MDKARPVTPLLDRAAALDDVRPRSRTRWQAALPRLASGWPLALVLVVPLLLLRDFWSGVMRADWPRALDGSGHYALARIYANTIFPDTFGWTMGFFGGMPFPNFYPPVFYWTIALFERAGLLDSLTALKLMIGLPLLLLPAVIWLLAKTITGGARPVMYTAAALSLVPLLVPAFHGSHGAGLNYNDTFATGLYSQPLAFIFLLLWYRASYPAHPFTLARVIATGALFGLVLLTNFFMALVAGVLAGLLALCAIWRAANGEPAGAWELAARGVSAALGTALAWFWLQPMLGTYDYFVTRPLVEVVQYPSTVMWVWYAAAVSGVFVWLARADAPLAYFVTCLGLVAALGCAAFVAPAWFPLQAFRLTPVLTYFTALPAALLIVTAAGTARDLAVRRLPRMRRIAGPIVLPLATAFIVVVIALAASGRLTARVLNSYLLGLSFYAAPGDAEIQVSDERARAWAARHTTLGEPLIGGARIGHGNPDGGAAVRDLRAFVRTHQDSRYLVELPDGLPPRYRVFDARAITSYIAAEGGEAAGAAFREASPSSLFVNPLVNALSADVDAFGLSSLLADDLGFAEQPLETHVRRAAYLGVRYLVMSTPEIRAQLERMSDVHLRYQDSAWGIYELASAHPAIEVLPYLPAAVFAEFTLKSRRRGDVSFVRLAEEQFADGWFDVPLVRSPAGQIEQMTDLDRFGALVVAKYDCSDCERAYQRLAEFGRTKPLVLVRGPGQLFRRLVLHRDRVPMLHVIDMAGDSPATLRTAGSPVIRYEDTHIRRGWRQMRAILDRDKIAVPAARATGTRSPRTLRVDLRASSTRVPVLIRQTYHPRWGRPDGRALYAGPAFQSVTFAEAPFELRYARSPGERAAVTLSAVTAAAMAVVFLIPGARARSIEPRRDSID